MQGSAIMYIRFLGFRDFRTIFAKQSLVSTLQGSGPAELGGFRTDRGWHGIRNHASKEAREYGLSGGLDAALLPRTGDA